MFFRWGNMKDNKLSDEQSKDKTLGSFDSSTYVSSELPEASITKISSSVDDCKNTLALSTGLEIADVSQFSIDERVASTSEIVNSESDVEESVLPEDDDVAVSGDPDAVDDLLAYDLENGSLMDIQSSIDEPFVPRRTEIKSAKEFFNTEILYRFDILENFQRKKLNGCVRIELKGYQGGVWSVIIGDNNIEVVNRKEEADLVIVMQQKDFLHIVNGRINCMLAILAQKMKIIGDVSKALDFQILLVPQLD